MASQPHQQSPFPLQHAFVVQCTADTGLAAENLKGRIEHVVSGQAAQFHSLEALRAFMAHVLTACDSPWHGQPAQVCDDTFSLHPDT